MSPDPVGVEHRPRTRLAGTKNNTMSNATPTSSQLTPIRVIRLMIPTPILPITVEITITTVPIRIAFVAPD
jgi:hypothetical protein